MKRQWTDQEVEELIRRAVSRSVPDIYRQVAAQQVPPLINEDHIVPPPIRHRRRRWPFALAALFLVGVGVLLYLMMSTAAIISIGANRDVELSVNRFERVLAAHSNSDAGEAILGGQTLKNQPVDQALETVFTSMEELGYLDGLDQLPVQVDGGSWQYNRTLTSAAQEALDRVVAQSAIGADPSLSPDPGTSTSPSGQDDGVGGAVPPTAPVSVAPSQTGGGAVVPSAPPASAAPSASQQLSEEQAKQAALSKAGVAAGDAVFTKIKQDWDDGRMLYEMEFYTASTVYDCEVDASTGAVIKLEQETRQGSGAAPAISASQAQQTALSHAGLSASQVTELQSELDEENGRAYYEVEFKQGSTEYQYEIDASTGAVLKSEVER